MAEPTVVPVAPADSAAAESAGANAAGWGSRIGVILAVAGSAVGLGNFLRFPGQAAQNGGGAFLVPYFISLLVLGIPLAWAEWTMGRYGGLRGFNSAPGIYASVWRNRFAKYFGALAVLIPLAIYFYYVLIEAWCLGYAITYLTGGIDVAAEKSALAGAALRDGNAAGAIGLTDADAYNGFFDRFVGTGADGAVFDLGLLTFILPAVFALNFVLIWRGVDKGIETFCKFAIPAMVVLALVVLVRVLTLPAAPDDPARDVNAGLGFMWNPDWAALLSGETWLAAAGQIFFSLSVGFGVIINYASYLRRNDDVALSGLTASSMNEFFEVCLGGLITLPAAFIFLGAGAGEQGTFDLGFKALPNVFAATPGGNWVAAAWFTMLFLAAVTSSVSMLNPAFAFLKEALNLKRNAATAVLLVLSVLGTGAVAYFSKNLLVLDTVDFWVGTASLFILALIQVLLYGWAFGVDRGDHEMHRGAHIRVPKLVQYHLKWVAPAFLLVIFGVFCFQNLPARIAGMFGYAGDAEVGWGNLTEIVGTVGDDVVPVAGYTFLGILALLAGLALVIAVTARRWVPPVLPEDDDYLTAAPASPAAR